MGIEADPTRPGAGRTVLVVDDNAAIRTGIAAAFLSDGFKKCAEAANGREAIAAAKRIKPDLITLDLSMPGMNGLQTASELRKQCPKTPIILFTMYGDIQLTKEAARVGIDLVFPKTEPLSNLLVKAHELIHE